MPKLKLMRMEMLLMQRKKRRMGRQKMRKH
jgi:hypothetical protein